MKKSLHMEHRLDVIYDMAQSTAAWAQSFHKVLTRTKYNFLRIKFITKGAGKGQVQKIKSEWN
jgi:hypothetical protein